MRAPGPKAHETGSVSSDNRPPPLTGAVSIVQFVGLSIRNEVLPAEERLHLGSHTQGLTRKTMTSKAIRQLFIPLRPKGFLSDPSYTRRMERLWTPWRSEYVTGKKIGRKGVPELLSAWPGDDTSCVFCNMLGAVQWAKESGMPAEQAERAAGILTMETHCFVCLNAFPYSSGHLMILPYVHTASLAALPSTTANELILLAQRAESWLHRCYQPDGLNFGMNLGEAAGAGVAGHLHLHGLPRWAGDGSFMMTTADTRVLPETPADTWSKLRLAIAEEGNS